MKKMTVINRKSLNLRVAHHWLRLASPLARRNCPAPISISPTARLTTRTTLPHTGLDLHRLYVLSAVLHHVHVALDDPSDLLHLPLDLIGLDHLLRRNQLGPLHFRYRLAKAGTRKGRRVLISWPLCGPQQTKCLQNVNFITLVYHSVAQIPRPPGRVRIGVRTVWIVRGTRRRFPVK